MLDVAIIGGGLSGLFLAYQLQQAGCRFRLFESRSRFGGRVLSLPASRIEIGAATLPDPSFRYDLGAGWIWPDSQPRIAALVEQFGLTLFPQWLEGDSLYQTGRETPPRRYFDHATYASARRVAGGSERLTDELLRRLPPHNLQLNYHLLGLRDRGDRVELSLNTGGSEVQVTAHQVVLCLPPRVVGANLSFTPALDPRLMALMQNTPTWMAGHAKALIRYSEPFWREGGLSGSVLAGYAGAVLGEVFDAGSEDGTQAALSGFFAIPAPMRRQYRNDLYALVLDQLIDLFGPQAASPEEVMVKEWSDEPLTATAADDLPPMEHPRYGHPWFELDHWNDKLHFCGTETAAEFGGYMEGALEAAERVAAVLQLGRQPMTKLV
ncbi:hypothetical protein GCM10011352_05910 [Marinobacterium zhoushanense]|uniref:Amine oxidase domain-containing protein n=2 Tax=Marinobacterium zhoushanense TaxID=1679163 RepID=A0ABQ1K0P3_9GAMM|nr:hypothetical protein GCM10011352_05910 [Marinobacterium zhoushanense]